MHGWNLFYIHVIMITTYLIKHFIIKFNNLLIGFGLKLIEYRMLNVDYYLKL
jgi:hypothetical protein